MGRAPAAIFFLSKKRQLFISGRPISDFYDESASSKKKKKATGKAGKNENVNGSPATKSKNSPRKPIRKYVQTAEDDNDQMVETQRGIIFLLFKDANIEKKFFSKILEYSIFQFSIY